jgi:hypothetical protein
VHSGSAKLGSSGWRTIRCTGKFPLLAAVGALVSKKVIELRWQQAVIEQALSSLDISEESPRYLTQLLDTINSQLAVSDNHGARGVDQRGCGGTTESKAMSRT